MAPLLSLNIAGAALLRRTLERPGPAAQLARRPGVARAAVEVFVWSERHADSAAARALRKPGHELQRLLGTREPSERQLEVGRAALAEILRVEPAPIPACSLNRRGTEVRARALPIAGWMHETFWDS